MASYQKRCAFALVQLVLLIAAAVGHSQYCLAEIRVGLAKADLTPPVGGLTTGYSSAKPTDGVHDPVYARIVVMSSGSETVALVSCDLCIYNSPELHERVSELGVTQLLLANTHTHAGPKLSQDDFPSAARPWRQTVDERILRAIEEAMADTFVGYFAATETHIQLGYNRLVQRGEFAVTHFENPERIPYGEVDSQVGIVRVSDDQGRVRAVLVNYACHPVVLGPRNIKISADYPGVTCRLVEEHVGDDAMCVFLQGAAGDVNPLFLARGDNRETDFPVVQRMGTLLANEVKRGLSFIEDQNGISDSFVSRSAVESFQHRFDAEERLQLGVTTLLVNDDICFVTMPGEPFHAFQKELRHNADMPHAYLIGYCCNDGYAWPSYLPDLRSAARGGYGASDTTKAAVGSGERLLNQGLVQLFQLQGRLKESPMRHTFDGEK